MAFGIGRSSVAGSGSSAGTADTALASSAASNPAMMMTNSVKSGNSTTWSIFSDSTGVYTAGVADRWPFRVSRAIGQAAGAAARVEFYQWDDTTQKYLAPVIQQAGTFGEQYLLFDGSAGVRSRILTSTSYGNHTGDDLEVEIKMQPAVIPPPATQVPFAHTGGVGVRGHFTSIATNGDLIFTWFEQTTEVLKSFTTTAAALGMTSGTDIHIRFKLDADNGAAGYTITCEKTINNGASWTLINSATVAGITSVQKAPAGTGLAYEIGARGATISPFNGKIYRTLVRDGFDGPLLIPHNLEAYAFTSGNSTLEGAGTFRVFCGAAVGKDLLYMNDVIRFPKLLGPITAGLVTLNDGHNEANRRALEWQTPLDLWYTMVKARTPLIPASYLVQNPGRGVGGALLLAVRDSHIGRQREGQSWAHKNGLIVFDTMSAFYADPRGLAVVENADGIHPQEPEGYLIQAQAVGKVFGVTVTT